ncbi:hypothetical protein [Propionivibrio dicarboxylicus]|uniref:Uncharacterized protein n=1 Tax=Propionivibrio dicarboxylicus TaxID=83767 RepID=A0A1G8LBS6_9RHOO|nr:hypothetical protein [Propionivibrio dicarboxylicus]SDI53154.1 hypothetical protein SAMN05660652_03596 [Propionivibrio dicarboxylicus]
MTAQELKRRSSLLMSISFGVSTVLALRKDIEMTHFIVASADLVRADIDWLVEMGLIQWSGEVARCTERGHDVVAKRAKFPGEA